MIDIALFAEDFGHEEFLGALILRIALEVGIDVVIHRRSVRGGHGKALSELRQYLTDLNKGESPFPISLLWPSMPTARATRAAVVKSSRRR